MVGAAIAAECCFRFSFTNGGFPVLMCVLFFVLKQRKEGKRKFKEKGNAPHFFPCPRTSGGTSGCDLIQVSYFLFSCHLTSPVQLLWLDVASS
jgi:hypothetical protein